MFRLYIFLPVGIIAVSTASIFIKLCDAPVLIIATYRMMLASLVLVPFACYKKTWRGWERNEWGWLLFSGLFLSLHFAFWIASLKYTSVASSVVLVTTHPIFVGIGGVALLKGKTWAEINIRNRSLRFGERIDQLRGYEPFKRSFDRRWVCPSGGRRSLRIFACGKKNEKGSESDLLYLPSLFNGWIDFDSPFPYFSRTFFRIFIVYLFLSLSPRLRPSTDRSHDFQLGLKIS